MKSTTTKIAITFAAGCLGGVAINAINIAFGFVNFPAAIGVDILQDTNLAHLYLDLFWGGVWGFLFLIPILNNLLLLKGAILSIFPTLAQIFLIVPTKAGMQLVSGEFGMMDLVYIFILNLVWGLVAAFCLLYVGND